MDAGSDSSTQRIPEAPKRTPLPVKQLLVLATILLAEPLTNSIIRSFDDASALNDPGQGFVDDSVPEGTNFYSQFLESSLFLAKAATAYQWGRLSDRLGRRPILLMGPLGLSLSTWALGLTNNTWVQTTARSMQGVFAGNMETTKSVIAEVTDTSNRHRAYAAIPFVQSIGISIGSSLGNVLAGLDERFPILERISFLKHHPLFIPCTIAAAFSFFVFHVAYHGCEETLPPEFQVNWKALWSIGGRMRSVATSAVSTSNSGLLDQTRGIGYGAVHRVQDATEDVITGVRQEVTQRVATLLPTDKIQDVLRLRELVGPELIFALVNYAFISFLDQAQQTLLPLMYTAPVQESGLGLAPDEMTQIMAKWGSYNTLAQLILFPWLLQRYGPKKVYATCLVLMVAFFALFPALHLVVKHVRDGELVVRPMVSLHMAMSSPVYMAYGCAQLFIMDAVPDRRSLGSINGIGQSVGSSVRMVAPPFISVFHALSGRDSKYAGYLVYIVLVSITVIGVMMSSLLPRSSDRN